jgi:threonylcarbamoyladenosine tRNA methylthiotransferase MtaB
MLLAAGSEIVSSPREADVAVFNSCTVTREAEADLRSGVRRAARQNSALRSVVMGCAAALDTGAIAALPSVDVVVGGADLPRIASALGIDGRPAAGNARAQSTVRAVLRIQDGCDEHCTFCATTLARGANRSRSLDGIVQEARQLSEFHPEIVLTGIHIGTYGHDVGRSLGELVEQLVTGVPSVRFRLSSIEATELDARLRELFGDTSGRLVPSLHAPLQSGSDRVLRRMGRHWYSAAAYADGVARVVDGRPVFGLGADVIAGFPGETDADHRATMRLITGLPFTSLHVFPFSARPGTAAERLGDPCAPGVVAERAAELRALGAGRAQQYRQGRRGGNADVVVVADQGRRDGVTEDYLTVSVADSIPRGARFRARLVGSDERLTARPLQALATA